MRTILDYLKIHGEMNESEAQDLLAVKRTRAYTVMRQMREMGLIVADGRGANKKYRLRKL